MIKWDVFGALWYKAWLQHSSYNEIILLFNVCGFCRNKVLLWPDHKIAKMERKNSNSFFFFCAFVNWGTTNFSPHKLLSHENPLKCCMLETLACKEQQSVKHAWQKRNLMCPLWIQSLCLHMHHFRRHDTCTADFEKHPVRYPINNVK